MLELYGVLSSEHADPYPGLTCLRPARVARLCTKCWVNSSASLVRETAWYSNGVVAPIGLPELLFLMFMCN